MWIIEKIKKTELNNREKTPKRLKFKHEINHHKKRGSEALEQILQGA